MMGIAYTLLKKASLHKVHCANPGAVIGAVDFNGAWKISHIEGRCPAML